MTKRKANNVFYHPAPCITLRPSENRDALLLFFLLFYDASMATPHQQATRKEGRLELAIQAYQQGKIESYENAATTYDISRRTMMRRISGIQPRLGSTAKNRLLTSTEEESLVQWILSL